MGRKNLVWLLEEILEGRREISLSPKIATAVLCLAAVTMEKPQHPALKEMYYGRFWIGRTYKLCNMWIVFCYKINNIKINNFHTHGSARWLWFDNSLKHQGCSEKKDKNLKCGMHLGIFSLGPRSVESVVECIGVCVFLKQNLGHNGCYLFLSWDARRLILNISKV